MVDSEAVTRKRFMPRPVRAFAVASALFLLSACERGPRLRGPMDADVAVPPAAAPKEALPEWIRDDTTAYLAVTLGDRCGVQKRALGDALHQEFVRMGAAELSVGDIKNLVLLMEGVSPACPRVGVSVNLQGREAYGNAMLGLPEIVIGMPSAPVPESAPSPSYRPPVPLGSRPMIA